VGWAFRPAAWVCDKTNKVTFKAGGAMYCATLTTDDTGGASRFFYVAKANSSERPREGDIAHPTVKPVTLLSYLVRLVTPPGGTVLEPFAGSGTTLEACVIEGFHAIGIEREADYLPLIEQRLSKPIQQVLA
jgi:DNA modification methylase